MAQFVEKAVTSAGSPFVRFVLRADEDRIKALKTRLNTKQPDIPRDICCGTVAHLINEYVPIHVPYLASWTPSGLGYFLAGLSKTQNSPIAKIEHVGSSDNISIISQLKNGEGERMGILCEVAIGFLLCAKIVCPCCDCCDAS